MAKTGLKLQASAAMLVLFLSVLPGLSFGEQYPTKSINLLISFAPAGVVDISARLVASKAEKILGRPFMITNNGGGAGAIASGITAKQPADGYHLLGCGSTSLIRVPQQRTVPYKLDDFTPVMHYGTPLSGAAVRSDSPWKTFKELVEYAKKNPGKITYSTSGAGGPHHLSMEFVAKQEGLTWTHIPYKGGTPSFMALLGNHVQVNIGSSWIFHSEQGAIRPLAVHSEKRSKMYPNVPTFRECGYDFINETVFMFAAPKGTPPEIIAKLDGAFRAAMEDPEVIEGIRKLGIDLEYRNSADTMAYLKDAFVRIGKQIKELNVKEN